MSFFEFANESPWLTFLLACVIVGGLVSIFQAIFGRKCNCKKKKLED